MACWGALRGVAVLRVHDVRATKRALAALDSVLGGGLIMPHLFGTDGVRGIPGRYPLDEGTVSEIAEAAARVLLKERRPQDAQDGQAPWILLGRDTRESGRALSRWLVEGFAAAGCRTRDLGVITTPAVAYLTPRLGALAGAVVSASHNPAKFNGVKFFTGDGYKMPPELEEKVEQGLSPEGKARPRRCGARPKTRAPWCGAMRISCAARSRPRGTSPACAS